MSTLTFGGSSTESLYDFSDELNDSVYEHLSFTVENIDENIQIHDTKGKMKKQNTLEDSKFDNM
jgi:hypothetical protein